MPNTNLPVASAHSDQHLSRPVQKFSDFHSSGMSIFGLWRRSERNNGASAISTDFTIQGDIKCNGRAELDGAVFGNVECTDLVVGTNGRIVGDVHAESVVVFGRIEGSVHGSQVRLKSTAAVEGDIYHQNLGIEVGAIFRGKSVKLTDDPQTTNGVESWNGEAPVNLQADNS